jgi:hypothetical protein
MSYSSTDATTNYSRLCRVVVELCRDMLWAVLTKEILPYNLDAEVGKHKAKFDAHEKSKITPTCTRDRCDTSLVGKLIRQLTTTIAPTQGWFHPKKNRVPPPTVLETEPGDDVERLHQLRNVMYGHAVTGGVSDVKFTDYWKEVREVCTRLDIWLGPGYEAALCKLETEETTNYSRLCRFDVELSLDLLWDVLEKKIPTNLDAEVRKHIAKFDAHEKSKIIPVCTHLPTPSDITIGDDVQRLLNIHDMCHVVSGDRVSEAEYTAYWQQVKDVCTRLDVVLGPGYKAALCKLETVCMDPKMEAGYRRKFQEMYERWLIQHAKVEKLEGKDTLPYLNHDENATILVIGTRYIDRC